MCGICGIFNYRSQVPASRVLLKAMADSIAHRGPDDEGYCLDGALGLGFRRLSIIDLAGGHQPMSDREKSVWVAFNGEIYNYLELKSELESHGHVFRTSSDTEVIVHGFKQWGTDVFQHLNGMFGVAIWDVRTRRLIVARDRFGIKLVYYKDDGNRLLFGSEMRAVLRASGESTSIDPDALNLFLRYRFTPSPHTIVAGIQKLAPGTMLICNERGTTLQHWYRFCPSPFMPPKSIAQAEDELLSLYRKAMKRHLLSDVPVGLLLSGGVDSGMLLGLMNEFGTSWPTYTVGYGSSFTDDELSEASQTAALFNARHTEVRLSRDIFESALSTVVSSLEEPIASSSIVPMYFVCQRARQDVKVALIGQGPDELFGGYRRHVGVRYRGIWKSMPAALRTPLAAFVSALPRNEALKRGIDSLAIHNRGQLYQQVLSLMPAATIDGLFHDGLLSPTAGDSILESWQKLLQLQRNTDELGGFQFIELRSTLPDELLMFGDKLSMAHGLEGRVPYLDKEIVEYAECLPANMKVRLGSGKWLHRKVCANYLPKSIIQRKKRGFAVNVVDDWFKSAMNHRLKDLLLDPSSRIYEYLHPSAVEKMVRSHESKEQDNHKVLFSLALFEEWLRAQPSPSTDAEIISAAQITN